MTTPVSELQKINPSSIVELFQLELNTTMHGVSPTYYFHNGTNNYEGNNVVFNNIDQTSEIVIGTSSQNIV